MARRKRDPAMKTLATATVRSTDTPYRQDIETRGFHLVGDEPPEPAGPGPYDYFLTGLGMCTTITLQMYAYRKGWDLGTVSVSLTLTKDADGQTHIHRRIHATGDLSDRQWDRLLEIAAKTPVTRTVIDGAEVTSDRGDAAAP